MQVAAMLTDSTSDLESLHGILLHLQGEGYEDANEGFKEAVNRGWVELDSDKYFVVTESGHEFAP